MSLLHHAVNGELMLRIHFTDRDLAKVHVATDPLWDTVLAVHQLSAGGAAAFSAWRRRAAAAVTGTQLAADVRMVRLLAPERAGYFPDFLTPASGRDGMRAGLDELCRTPHRRLAEELTTAFARHHQVPGWMNELADGRADRLDRLALAMGRIHRAVVAPAWSCAMAAVETDRAIRLRALRDRGAEGLLTSLRPLMQWEPPVLETPYPERRDLYLDGRGLCLVPSRFCWRMPVALADPALPQVLVYPAAPAETASGSDLRVLAPLLGRTRARVLAALDGAVTTGELAAALSVSASSASEHVAVLRTAGLAVTRRADNRVLHLLSPLGRRLLHGR
ncbi:helix-turn-helix domain-containing protein [Streptomyces sp. NBC_00893]|uniref:helix-turn-helix domain-containing protein n=1 Tax=Streptomyces sp. NBC_00893 TaxID=2975862 RepID=UPI002257A852|nr:helix-turn-helix domain-containing protein [Streptomyces sp. NBC_00893]MCX4850369.1 helix-turn-helix domain-containing protein [Streptomyces sp. NBC_00893]